MTQYRGATAASSRGSFMQAFGNAVAYDDTVTITAALTTDDTVDLLRIPRGTRLLELFTYNGDLDTHADTPTLEYKIGYRKVDSAGALVNDDDYFGATLTAAQAAVTADAPTRYAFAPKTFDEDVFITLTPTGAAAVMGATATMTAVASGIAVGGK